MKSSSCSIASLEREVMVMRIQEPCKNVLAVMAIVVVGGMRTDIDGRLFVARPDAGSVAIFSPDGTSLREIHLLGKGPTNLAFGGSDGKTVFVTQSDGGYIEAFLTDRPGRIVYKGQAVPANDPRLHCAAIVTSLCRGRCLPVQEPPISQIVGTAMDGPFTGCNRHFAAEHVLPVSS
jgi:hypothetical protein